MFCETMSDTAARVISLQSENKDQARIVLLKGRNEAVLSQHRTASHVHPTPFGQVFRSCQPPTFP